MDELIQRRIKVLALIVFFILAICISTGGIGGRTIGFKYWHDPGPFADSINGVAKTFVVAGTLYAGTEMYVILSLFLKIITNGNRVGITAGESSNPQKAVPIAIKQVFWRILVFYIGTYTYLSSTIKYNILTTPGTMFFIGILMPYTDNRLIGDSSSSASSPLTIGLSDAGILPAAHLINALIVVSVISAGIGSLYASSRTILFMARTGKAPKILGRTNARGVPWVAIVFSNIFTCIVFLTVGNEAGKVYNALITLSGGMSPTYIYTAQHTYLISQSK